MLKRKACPLKDLVRVPVLTYHFDIVPLSEQVGLGMRKILGKVTPVLPQVTTFLFYSTQMSTWRQHITPPVAHLGQTSINSTFIYAPSFPLFSKWGSFPHFLKECSPHPSQLSRCITKSVQLSRKPMSISSPAECGPKWPVEKLLLGSCCVCFVISQRDLPPSIFY